ncbi:MAG: DUF1460 domain-containing protein [Bacteroidales bacterium]|nr:DUF1460 domain-containing protein [Bacteroidales bacterium]
MSSASFRNKWLAAGLLLALTLPLSAQQRYESTAQDIALGEMILGDLGAAAGRESGPELMIRAARMMLGQEYVANTQEGREEKLRIYLTKTDCILFVDNTLGLVLTAQRLGEAATFEDLAQTLEPARHNEQRIADGFAGYATRVHYVTEWIDRGVAAGVFSNLTDSLGGVPDTRTIQFMSTHPDSYAPLTGESPTAQRNLGDIVRMEEAVNRIPRSYIPKGKLPEVEDRIQSGDILCFATSIDGLDYSHVVIAYRAKKGDRLGFIHASSAARKVIVEPRTLEAYLQAHGRITGISVLRLEK